LADQVHNWRALLTDYLICSAKQYFQKYFLSRMIGLRILGILVLVVFVHGCATAPHSALRGPDHAVVRVFFATNRNIVENANPNEMFGALRSGMRYGTSDVSISRDPRVDKLEAAAILRVEFRDDEAKNGVLLDVTVQLKDRFFSDLAARVAASPKANAFIFIHGYRIKFEEAVIATAQMTYDLGFEGAPVLFSWPSHSGNPIYYTLDESNIEWAQYDLRNFLEDFLAHSKAQNIYLIGHSIGTRALTGAVASLVSDKPALRQRFREIILAGPDIDADIFRRDIAPVLVNAGQKVTLYGSTKDFALAISKGIHEYPRAGDLSQGVVVMPGVETMYLSPEPVLTSRP
jgi:esterase/lipase superfamily enzyme